MLAFPAVLQLWDPGPLKKSTFTANLVILPISASDSRKQHARCNKHSFCLAQVIMSVSVAKNYVAVVVDVSVANGCSIDERKSQLMKTIDAARSTLKFKSIFSPQNSILIVCVGTKGVSPTAWMGSNYPSNTAIQSQTPTMT